MILFLKNTSQELLLTKIQLYDMLFNSGCPIYSILASQKNWKPSHQARYSVIDALKYLSVDQISINNYSVKIELWYNILFNLGCPKIEKPSQQIHTSFHNLKLSFCRSKLDLGPSIFRQNSTAEQHLVRFTEKLKTFTAITSFHNWCHNLKLILINCYNCK